MGFPPVDLESNHAESWQQHSKNPISTVIPGLLVLAHGHTWMWAAAVWVCSGDGVVGTAPSLVAAAEEVTAEVSSKIWVCLGPSWLRV